ncbi:uncharacterized protein LOC106163849 [Lingula anatina]|uniref:Uncharacterized protein LOC106163849 n=1 Tax=Lingula anatina TaxID=7574 RepID=A0A1S3IFF6_LINAN|nr:uncharacterized protein LOC106163849 [Lingula anatina]|eukprot:XP_013397000.1 uncharacterized protein LOC106163849 [Lingula anatina]
MKKPMVVQVYASLFCVLLICLTVTEAYSYINGLEDQVTDLDKEVDVLSNLVRYLKSRTTNGRKRQIDAGFGSRNTLAQDISRLVLAQHKAQSYNSPGRRRRSINTNSQLRH